MEIPLGIKLHRIITCRTLGAHHDSGKQVGQRSLAILSCHLVGEEPASRLVGGRTRTLSKVFLSSCSLLLRTLCLLSVWVFSFPKEQRFHTIVESDSYKYLIKFTAMLREKSSNMLFSRSLLTFSIKVKTFKKELLYFAK